MGYGVQSSSRSIQTGWRLPSDLVEEIYLQARQEGLRPGAYAARLLRRELEQQAQPIPTQELLTRIHFPPGL